MLYRIYRPQTFKQVVGQEHVVRTLQGGFASGRIGHAYLFAGPRGTGKTTIARILAKALNCAKRGKDGEPDNSCDACLAVNEGRSLDLIEIDAASNRGIDEIRSLKESASVAAPMGGYKVFLVDEVHMLTKEAFNALLKLLEEPPAHVVFILATTDAHKILPTVLSRVQRFDFKKLTVAQIAAKLKTISKKEKLEIDDEALLTIASSSDGALRDAEVSLSKVMSVYAGKAITAEHVRELLGLIPAHYHPEFLGYLTSNDRPAALAFIQKLYDGGVNLEHFSKDFLDYLRQVLVTKINPAILAASQGGVADEHMKRTAAFASQLETDRLVRFITSFTNARAELKFSPIPQLPLELVVVELTANSG